MAQIGIADKNTLDAVKTKVDNYLDASVSTRATQTTLNTVNTNVGSNSDGASVSGSVHAKLKDVRSYISSLVSQIRNRTQTITYAEADKDSLTTVRSVSGSGYFSVFSMVRQYQGSFKITVDSSVLLNNKELFNGGNVSEGGGSGFPIVINMRYNSSYKVEHKGELVRTWVQEAAD